MFPSVRHLIVAVVASVVALSCGFAMFAAFRVNHEPLSRLATGPAPLQLAAGNPISSVAMPAPAESFGDRFPPHQAAIAGASTEAPPQPEHDDSVEPPRAVASTTTTAPATDAAEPAPPAPVAQAPATVPDAKPDDVAATPSEPPPVTPSEPVPATTETAATEPPAEPAASAEPAAPTEQASQELKQEPNPESNPDTKPNTATTTTAEPPASEAPRKAAHRHRLAAKAQRARQARATVQPVSQPPGIGGPFVPPPSRLVAKPQRPHQARAIVQPVSQPSGVGGPFVPPTGH